MREILTPDNRTTQEIVGLHPYTVYSFRVIVVNAMGSSRPSKESYYMVTLREGEFFRKVGFFSFSANIESPVRYN